MAYFIAKIYRVCLPIGLWGSLLGGCTTPPSSITQSPASPTTVASASPTASTPLLPPDASTDPASSPSPNPQATLTAPSTEPSVAETAKDLTILSKLQEDLSQKVTIAKQDIGKTYLSNLLLSQQAEKLVKGRFTSDLKRLAPDVPTETDEYRIEIKQADAAQAVLVAIAKQPGFASYTGVAFAVEGGIPITGICKTNTPSQAPPATPKLINSAILCPSGSASAMSN